MTYGGSVPTITPGVLGLRQRRHRLVADHAAHLHDHGHQLEPGRRDRPTRPRAAGAVDPNYSISYVAGPVTVDQGPADDHRLERLHDLRRARCRLSCRATPGFVNGDTPASLTTQPTCSTTATSSSPVVGLAVPVVVQRRGRPQLRHQLRRRLGDGQPGAADDHRLEPDHDLRRSVPTITAGYSGFVNGDTAVVADDAADLLDDGHQLEPGLGPPYPSSCGGAVDPNYTISYVGGAVTVSTAPLTITASSGSMTYGGSPRRPSRRSTRASSTVTAPRR